MYYHFMAMSEDFRDNNNLSKNAQIADTIEKCWTFHGEYQKESKKHLLVV